MKNCCENEWMIEVGMGKMTNIRVEEEERKKNSIIIFVYFRCKKSNIIVV